MALKELTLFDGEIDKIQISIDRLRQFEPPDGYECANSGGKDSAVIAHLCKESGVKHLQFHNLTTVDAPETMYHLKKHYPECEIRSPRISMWKLIVERGIPPLRQMRYCCEVLKERNTPGAFVVLGVRTSEGKGRTKRSQRKFVESCMKNPAAGVRYLNPIIDWSDDEVWEYISLHTLPTNPLYAEGRKRVGCVGCPMYDQKKDFKRWPIYARNYRRACNKLFDEKRKDTWTWQSGDELFEWWESNRSKKGDPDQTVMFE